ncbi:dienelactone hydrolase family protein [Nocardioides pacificus]
MSEVLLFHHALGLTPGVHAFADSLRAAGHTVHVPDLYDGRVFDDLDAGVGHARETGFATISERARAAAESLPDSIVYAGFSLGVLPAQELAQTRPGARGALLFDACFPATEFGSWPAGLPGQIHGMDTDPWFVDGGDLEAARTLTAVHPEVTLHLYPGDQHLFADTSLPSYDAAAARLLLDRVLELLERVG